MGLRVVTRLACGFLLAAALLAPWNAGAEEPSKTLKIGVVYDLTGPFAGGGSPAGISGRILRDWGKVDSPCG